MRYLFKTNCDIISCCNQTQTASLTDQEEPSPPPSPTTNNNNNTKSHNGGTLLDEASQ